MESKLEFSKYLKNKRQHLKLTQKELAETLGIPLGTLRNWEQGIRTPNNFTQNAIFEKIKEVQKMMNYRGSTMGVHE